MQVRVGEAGEGVEGAEEEVVRLQLFCYRVDAIR